MTMKIKTITLTAGFRNDKIPMTEKAGYRVERVTDSVEYTPGDIITANEAAALCLSSTWKVTVAREAR